jgi:hypothetical protein
MPSETHDGLTLHAATEHADHDLKHIFKVEPGTNLYRVRQLPLLDYGREEITADAVLKRPRMERFKDYADFKAKVAEQDAFIAELPTWFVSYLFVRELEAQESLVLRQLHNLQRFPAATFNRLCVLSHLDCLDTLDEMGRTSRPRRTLPPVTEPWEGEPEPADDDFFMKAPDQRGRRDRTANEVILASLAKDPRQLDPEVAIRVEDPDQPGQYRPMGELLAPVIGCLDSYGIVLKTYLTEVRVLIVQGTFHATWLTSAQGIHRLSWDAIGGSLRAALAPCPLNPEETILRDRLGRTEGEA